MPDSNSRISSLYYMPCYYPVTFGNLQNSKKLRDLFAYGLPCMYTGIKMIDPKYVAKLIKNGTFTSPVSGIMNIFAQNEESITGMERKVVDILKSRAMVHPDKNLHDLLQEAEPIYRRDLRKKQTPVFYELGQIFKNLPEEYQIKFNDLMSETYKKLDEKPVIIPFSTIEFKYKLSKIRDYILNGRDLKAKRVMNVIIKQSKKFADSTNSSTINNQRKNIGMIDWIWKKSVLKDDEQLKNLIETSKSRLFYKEIIAPFSRKTFIYELDKIIKPLGDEQICKKIMTTALKLPTSSQSLSAYVMKLSKEPSEKIGFRLLWPSTASVEHILPRSCGGENVMANFGGATTRANSSRKSIELSQWVDMHPEIPYNCQKYIDKLIELKKEGVFVKHGIDPAYIKDFKNTVYEQSRGKINLDISSDIEI